MIDTERLEALYKAVGQCIEHQRSGHDVLASAEWDRVVEIWGDENYWSTIGVSRRMVHPKTIVEFINHVVRCMNGIHPNNWEFVTIDTQSLACRVRSIHTQRLYGIDFDRGWKGGLTWNAFEILEGDVITDDRLTAMLRGVRRDDSGSYPDLESANA